MTAQPVTELAPRTEIRLQTVTPELAKTWLTQNVSNRPVRRETVHSYARDMINGAWKVTGEAIKFSSSGQLLDGQHRLLAICQAKTPVPLHVATGIPVDSQDAMDSGMKRTAGDALALSGISNSAMTGAAARLALSVGYAPESIGRYSATHAEIISWVADHPDIADACSYTSSIAGRVKGCPPSVIAHTLHALAQINRSEAYAFWAAVADQVGQYPGDPVVALARKFSDIYREREQVSKAAYLSMIYRAWNSRRHSKPLRIVRVNSPGANGGLIPIPMPS